LICPATHWLPRPSCPAWDQKAFGAMI
jgi:hypothetical protein